MQKYDVLVIGGGTSGCAAAYTAGKLGLKTLLIEKGIHLGGAITSGLVVPVMKSGENQINTEFYQKLISELKIIGGQITYQDNPGWFNPELAKIVLDKMMNDANVDIRFNSYAKSAKIISSYINHVEVNTNILSVSNDTIYTNNNYQENSETLSEYIEAKYVVDATGNCEFSKLINCEFLENKNEFQPMSLRFIMSGIDRKAFGDWLLQIDSDRDVTTVEVIDGVTHLSTAYTWDLGRDWALAPYFNDAVAKNILKDTDRNYFQVFSVAGTVDSVAFNCPRIAENLDPNSTLDTTKALITARESILRLSEFCKKYFPGFENAYISNIADSLGVRVSNRIRGKYIYSIDDLRSGKKFDNPALISNYPVDVHSKDKNASTLEQTGEYQLPIESLMSNDYDNLFVVGRGISADYLAQGALRVQGSCFSMGEAVAKYIKSQINNAC
ncbi:FAD-dependent oxidoreductase [bacterium]|nr:FAD-dependent oxidoreductase [bacterium]